MSTNHTESPGSGPQDTRRQGSRPQATGPQRAGPHSIRQQSAGPHSAGPQSSDLPWTGEPVPGRQGARLQSAQEKIAAQRTAGQRQRRRLLLAGGSVLVVLVVAIAFIAVKLTSKPSAPAAKGAAASTSVVHSITTVPASTLNAIGPGTASPLKPTSGSQPLLTSGGKPEVLYVGAEYCPYCAAERWALAVALSRFGTFSGLHFIHSSATDVYPNTPTLTFYRSRYTSKYLVFTPVETETVSGTTLQKLTPAQAALFSKYDGPPYVPSADAESFPFVDFGNKALLIGAQYLPSALTGLTWSQVAAAIRDPSTTIAKDVDGAANIMTAEICKLTHGQPASVCTSAGVKAAAARS
jgi:thiol-disulfide isomerase/thioredoxin